MADKGDGMEGRPADPFVAARINNPAELPGPSFQLAGLLGDSDRDGHRRLYLNTRLDYYVEFRVADVLSVDDVGAQEPPFVGLDATRVTLAKDATVDYVRAQTLTDNQDSFELDARVATDLNAGPGGVNFPTDTLPTDTFPTNLTGVSLGAGCVPDTILSPCLRTRLWCFTRQPTCQITLCNTCRGTCVTCFKATCQTCFQGTCQTCDQATCHTCVVNQCWPTLPTGCAATCGPATCTSQVFRCATAVCP